MSTYRYTEFVLAINIMTQQIIVCIIGAVIAVYIAIAIYRLVTRRSDPCAGCAGCDLKSALDKKAESCSSERNKPDCK